MPFLCITLTIRDLNGHNQITSSHSHLDLGHFMALVINLYIGMTPLLGRATILRGQAAREHRLRAGCENTADPGHRGPGQDLKTQA